VFPILLDRLLVQNIELQFYGAEWPSATKTSIYNNYYARAHGELIHQCIASYKKDTDLIAYIKIIHALMG